MFSKADLTQILYQNKYLALLDQALLSVINFGSILVLAKTASVTVFGSFVVLYSYSLFVFLSSSLYISGPILVFLTKKWKNAEGEYLFSTLFMNLILCLSISAVAYFFLSKQISGVPYLPFFLMSLSMTIFNVLKKFVFSSKSVHIKYGCIATFILNLIFFVTLFTWKPNNLSDILFIYWISFFTADLLLLFFILRKGVFRKLSANLSVKTLIFLRTVTSTHYHYAKWILIGGLAFWGYTQGVYILAKIYGINDLTIGKVRTIQNLLGVFNILAISIENHFTPIFSEKLIAPTRSRIFSLIRSIYSENYKKILLLFLIALPVGFIFYNFMYFDKYGYGKTIFCLFFFIQFLLITIKPFTIVLKCIEKTKSFFVSHIIALIGMLVSLSLLIYYTDSYAIPISIAIATLIYILILLVFFKRETK